MSQSKDPGSTGVLGRLRAAGLLPRTSRGQHFLHDPRLLRTIVELADLGSKDVVFEVGTGPGTLTRHLACAAGRVLSVEVDPRLAAFASRELSGFPHVEILQRDALAGKHRLDSLVEARLRALGPFAWVSNLPYSVASPLIVSLLEAELPWSRAILTLQLEVGERLAAAPNSRAYGPLTLLVRFWATATILRRIAPGSFWPRPRVQSVVVRLHPHEPRPKATGYPAYRDWVHALFQARRKQLRPLLQRLLGSRAAEAALSRGGWAPDIRPAVLDVADFRLLAENFPLFER